MNSKLYKRITRDTFEVQGHKGRGWETETVSYELKEAQLIRRALRKTAQYPLRIKLVRERLPVNDNQSQNNFHANESTNQIPMLG